MFSKEEFCQKMREVRKEKGWKSKDLSVALGQSECYVSTIESKKIMPPVNVFFKMCDVLGVFPSEFFAMYTGKRNVQPIVDDLRAMSENDFRLAEAFVRWLRNK